MLTRLGQCFCDDQLRHVDAILKQIRDHLFCVVLSTFYVPVYEHLVEASFDDGRD